MGTELFFSCDVLPRNHTRQSHIQPGDLTEFCLAITDGNRTSDGNEAATRTGDEQIAAPEMPEPSFMVFPGTAGLGFVVSRRRQRRVWGRSFCFA